VDGLILASASPRRSQLLASLGLPHRVELPPMPVEEVGAGPPPVVAVKNARVKAEAVRPRGWPVLAADTVVADGPEILGKPAGPDEARHMLRRLRDRTHRVITAVVLTGPEVEYCEAVASLVRMRAYADAEVEAYIRRGEPFDKAGGYAIQDPEFRPAADFEGCYFGIVGLPLCALVRGLRALGRPVPPAGSAYDPVCRVCPAIRTGYHQPKGTLR
jgi:MAF protein